MEEGRPPSGRSLTSDQTKGWSVGRIQTRRGGGGDRSGRGALAASDNAVVVTGTASRTTRDRSPRGVMEGRLHLPKRTASGPVDTERAPPPAHEYALLVARVAAHKFSAAMTFLECLQRGSLSALSQWRTARTRRLVSLSMGMSSLVKMPAMCVSTVFGLK